MRLKWRLAASAAAWVIFSAPQAQALPIAAVIVGALGLSGTVAAVATFAIDAVIAVAGNFVLNKVFAPKTSDQAAAAAQERQASVTTLSVGENPRELIVGRAANAGTLVDAFNYGGQYGTDWEVLVVAVADHRCDALEGFYVDDTYVAYTADGLIDGYSGQLELHWRAGSTADAEMPADLQAAAAAADPVVTCLQPGAMKGVAHILFAYKADASDAETPVWSGGRPTFLPVIRGALMYDARLDSSVGGEGPQRWNDPSTRVWSENAEICRYNFARGIYALDQVDDPEQLLIGRGLSSFEAPPARVFAAANICDEEVDIGSGLTEPRYRVGGVIRSTDLFVDVETRFAAATAGVIIQPQGGVEVEPGQAKTPIADITDDDLIKGVSVQWSSFKSAQDQVNTVIPRYIEPSQKWADHGAPIIRDLSDIQTDGGPYEQTLTLDLVTSATQAQRVGAIAYRQARMERSGSLPLGPRFSHVEEGDWVNYASARRTGGVSRVFRVKSYSLTPDWRTALALEETSYDVYGFGGSPQSEGGFSATPPADALELRGVNAEAITTEGDDGSVIPAVRFHWTVPVDPAIQRIRGEVRLAGATAASPTITDLVNAGVMEVTNGVASNRLIEVRLVPLGGPGRPIVPSDWIPLATGSLVASAVALIDGLTPAQMLAKIQDASAQGLAAIQSVMDQANTISQALLDANAIRNRIAQAGFTTAGVPLGPMAQELRVQGADLVYTRSLMGLTSADRSSFILSDDTLQFTNGDTVADRFNLLYAADAANSAGLSTEQTARASADAAESSSRLSLAATVNANLATYSAFASSQATTNTSTTTAITGLTAQVGSNYAAYTSSLSTQATLNDATATSLSSLAETAAGQSSSITNLLTVTAGLGAQAVLSLDYNGNVAGYRFANGVSGSSLVFVGGTIGFTDGTGAVYPLTVTGGKVRISTLVAEEVEANSIVTNSIVGGAITASLAHEDAGGAGLSTSSGVSQAGLYFTSTGGQHVINVYGEIATTSSAAAGCVTQLLRNGVAIGRPGNKWCPGSWGGEGLAYARLDTPGPGTWYYELIYTATGGSGPCRTGSSTLIVTELKK